MSDASGEEKKIVIDEDFKSRVEAEKVAAEVLRQESHPTAETPSAGPEESPLERASAEPSAPLPPAEFTTIVSMLGTQAMMNLGTLPNPRRDRRESFPC